MIGLEEAQAILHGGGLVAFPTETVYGLGASAWRPDAIRSVFATKGRPSDNPLIVHLSSLAEVSDFAASIPPAALALMQRFWPGPLTVILPKRSEVLDIITAGRPAVALRIPDHPVALELLRHSGPLVAPSANRSGRPSPTTTAHVQDDLGPDFPLLEGGPCRVGLESTVVDLSERPFAVCRPGALSAAELSEVAGEEILPAPPPSSHASDAPRSPGMKYTHYSPQARIFWLPDSGVLPTSEVPEEAILFLYHTRPPAIRPLHSVLYQGDLAAMAKELYDRFRQADHLGLQAIGVEPLPSGVAAPKSPAAGLLAALRDRISKAIGR